MRNCRDTVRCDRSYDRIKTISCVHHYLHLQPKEIYDEVQQMTDELLQHGHNFDASWTIRSFDEYETAESVLCGYDENLAIAFHFMVYHCTNRWY